MNKVLEVYTELDSIYDYRRGLLQYLITEGIEDDDARRVKGDELWELHIAKNYKERRLDTFEYPELGLNREKFDAIYKERALVHWLMYYPSNFYNSFIRVIVERETLNDKPMGIKGLNLSINTFPYQLDAELEQTLLQHARTALGGLVKISLFYKDTTELDAHFYSRYQYVLKYDALIGSNSVKFLNSVGSPPIPDTVFLVPDILVRESDELIGTPADRIFAMSITLGPALTMMPLKHDFYDYAS